MNFNEYLNKSLNKPPYVITRLKMWFYLPINEALN